MARRLTKPAFFTLVALLGLSLAMPALARRAPPVDTAGPTAVQIAVRQVRQQIAAEELAGALALDAEQADAMVALISEGISLRSAKKEARAANAPELLELLEDYLGDVQKRGEPREATAEALREFREANRPQKGERKALRKEAVSRLREILSEEQLAVLANFKPMSAVSGNSEDQATERRRRGDRDEAERERGSDGQRHVRRQRKKARKMVRRVLFSEAMLEVLQR
jgi:hypothetical protein